jgi:hypothetical protein
MTNIQKSLNKSNNDLPLHQAIDVCCNVVAAHRYSFMFCLPSALQNVEKCYQGTFMSTEHVVVMEN